MYRLGPVSLCLLLSVVLTPNVVCEETESPEVFRARILKQLDVVCKDIGSRGRDADVCGLGIGLEICNRLEASICRALRWREHVSNPLTVDYAFVVEVASRFTSQEATYGLLFSLDYRTDHLASPLSPPRWSEEYLKKQPEIGNPGASALLNRHPANVQAAIIRFLQDGNLLEVEKAGQEMMARIWVLVVNEKSRGIGLLQEAKAYRAGKKAQEDIDDFIELVKNAPWPESQKSIVEFGEPE